MTIATLKEVYDQNLFTGASGISDGRSLGVSRSVAGSSKRVELHLLTTGAWCQLEYRRIKRIGGGDWFSVGAVSTGSVNRKNRWSAGFEYRVRIIRAPLTTTPVEFYISPINDNSDAAEGLLGDTEHIAGLAMHSEHPLIGAGDLEAAKKFQGGLFLLYDQDPSKNAFFGGAYDFNGTTIRQLHIPPNQLTLTTKIANYPGASTGTDTGQSQSLTGKLVEIDAHAYSTKGEGNAQVVEQRTDLFPDYTGNGFIYFSTDDIGGADGATVTYESLPTRDYLRPGRIYIRMHAYDIGAEIAIVNQTGTRGTVAATVEDAWHWRLADITAQSSDTHFSIIGITPGVAIDRVLIVDDDVTVALTGALGLTLGVVPAVEDPTPVTIDSTKIVKVEAEVWNDQVSGSSGIVWDSRSAVTGFTGAGYAIANGVTSVTTGGPILKYFSLPLRSDLKPGRIWVYVHAAVIGDSANIRSTGSGASGLITATKANEWHWVESSAQAGAYDRAVEITGRSVNFKIDKFFIIDNTITDAPVGAIGYNINVIDSGEPVDPDTDTPIPIAAAKMVAINASVWSDRITQDGQTWSSSSMVADFTDSGYARLTGVSVVTGGAGLRWYSLPERASGQDGHVWVRIRAATIGHTVAIRSQGLGTQGQVTATVANTWHWIKSTTVAPGLDRAIHVDGRDVGFLIDRIVVVDLDVTATPAGAAGFVAQ